MRVMLTTQRRWRRENESGATAVIVALSLIALLGVLVLVVDVGGLLYRRRQMVSAADAAALAAAQSCALGRATAGVPGTQADTFAQDNVGSVTITGGIVAAESSPGCETAAEGHVTVSYTSVLDLGFAGIFGANSANVVGKATAEWGNAGSGWPVPFIVTLSNSGNVFCKTSDGQPVDISENTPLGTTCAVWFDNSSSGGYFSGFGQSVFGSLNLNKWNVLDTYNCGSKDLDDAKQYAYVGGYDGTTPLLPLNYPAPTWVCNGDGESDSLYSSLENSVDKILVFPITDKTLILDNAGKIDKFNVVGYAALYLVDVLGANDTGSTESFCNTRTQDFAPGEVLDLLPLSTGCAPYQYLSSQSLSVSGSQGCCQEGPNRDYTLVTDAAGHPTGIKWGTNAKTNVTVSWSVTKVGPCGERPSNSSGQCLIVRWEGAQLGNGPLGGNNVGVPAVRLCDPSIAGSCDTVT